MKRYFYPLLGVISLIAACLRLFRLGSFPRSFNQDEMTQGYDAWSIWRTGHDQHGALLPLLFRNFNDYVPPVANYVTAPFVGLFGLDETTTRLPVALLGVATVVLAGLLGRLWFGEIAGLATALLLAFEPWHVNYSRIAFPASVVPFFTVAALYTYTRGIAPFEGDPPLRSRRSLGWLAASAAAFGLLFATYPTMKLEAPTLLLACLVAGIDVWRRHVRVLLAWLALVTLAVTPYLIELAAQWQVSQGRFNGLSVFTEAEWPRAFWANYRDHFNVRFLFFRGFDEGAAVHPHRVGELSWLEAPLIVIGLAGLAMRRRFWQRSHLLLPVLVLIWALTYPIASSLTITSHGIPNEMRAYNLLPLPELLAGYGLASIVSWDATRRWQIGKVAVLSAATLLFVAFNAVFLHGFFGQRGTPLNLGLRPALQAARSAAQPCDTVWVDGWNQTYMYYLFLTRTPPGRFQKARIGGDPTARWTVRSFENVRFGVPGRDAISPPALPRCNGRLPQTYFVTWKSALPEGWRDIAVVHNRGGVLLWRTTVHETPASG